jgi:DNA-binding NarL/FixJ family response regulator
VTAVSEAAEDVVAWAESGASGYIPRTAGIADLIPLVLDIKQGKQPCSASVAAGLLRRLSNGANHAAAQIALTAREAQIAQMIAAGLSNKDIARCLNIGLATTKTHVHHLLAKLNLERRGQAASWMREHGGRR